MQPFRASLIAMADVVRGEAANPETRCKVEARIAEFTSMRAAGEDAWFGELVFCLLTANYSARGALVCMNALTECGALRGGSEVEIRRCLVHRHRFPNARARYIAEAQRLRGSLKRTVQSIPDPRSARDWLVANVKGLGMKEASHFLRNVGYLDLAIVDKHILSHMEETGMIERRPSAISRKKYLEYEGMLKEVARDLGMPLGVMDLYLWSKKSGEVLK